jgi:uncharacterized membrane protein YfcA
MTSDLTLIALAAAVAFFVKAIAGFGGPLLAIPILAPTLGVEHSVVALSLANLMSNAMLMWEHRRGSAGAAAILVPMLSAGAVGTLVGTRFLTTLDDRWVSLAVATMVFAYVIRAITGARLTLAEAKGRSLRIPVGIVGGIMHGATGNSGPVFGTYLDALNLSRSAFVFMVSVPFFVLSTVQIATLVAFGAFTAERTNEALFSIVPVMIATFVGALVGRRVPTSMFRNIVLVMLTFAGVRLLWSIF